MQKDSSCSNDTDFSSSRTFSSAPTSLFVSTATTSSEPASIQNVHLNLNNHLQTTDSLTKETVSKIETGYDVPTDNSFTSNFHHIHSSYETSTFNNDHYLQNSGGKPTNTLTAKLNSYKYLDDYEYYRERRIKQNAMRRFGHIMQSIETKYKGCPQSTLEEENYSDILDETITEFPIFNQILRRHRKRFKPNPNLHHHRLL